MLRSTVLPLTVPTAQCSGYNCYREITGSSNVERGCCLDEWPLNDPVLASSRGRCHCTECESRAREVKSTTPGLDAKLLSVVLSSFRYTGTPRRNSIRWDVGSYNPENEISFLIFRMNFTQQDTFFINCLLNPWTER
ncbi:hypothetical protein J6590_002275 [Homalodisca vitripennis]|nr:hypothetical protein J6590_002275 [Homalodisca vitripennis]